MSPPKRISKKTPNAHRKQPPTFPTSRQDVQAVRMRIPEGKAILAWLLEQPARVFRRDEIARALGFNHMRTERGVQCLQRMRPEFAARVDETGARLPGGAGFIPAEHPLRAAWANTAPSEIAPPAPEPEAPAEPPPPLAPDDDTEDEPDEPEAPSPSPSPPPSPEAPPAPEPSGRLSIAEMTAALSRGEDAPAPTGKPKRGAK